DALVTARAASVPKVLAPEPATYAGYADAKALVQLRGTPMAFGFDGEGGMRVALADSGALAVKRFDADGTEKLAWRTEMPPDPNATTMAVSSDGTTLIVTRTSVRLYDAAGRQVEGWELPWPEPPR